MYYSTCYDSPLGKLLIVSDGEAVCRVLFHDNSDFSSSQYQSDDDLTIFRDVRNWFDDYFKGKNPQINFKLNPEGTEFRLRVWEMLCGIKYGETVTYGEIASRISPSMSAQAVGGAVGHNPIAIIIPCHRVLGANGKLTGYAGGIDRKIELLKLEKVPLFSQ